MAWARVKPSHQLGRDLLHLDDHVMVAPETRTPQHSCKGRGQERLAWPISRPIFLEQFPRTLLLVLLLGPASAQDSHWQHRSYTKLLHLTPTFLIKCGRETVDCVIVLRVRRARQALRDYALTPARVRQSLFNCLEFFQKSSVVL